MDSFSTDLDRLIDRRGAKEHAPLRRGVRHAFQPQDRAPSQVAAEVLLLRKLVKSPQDPFRLAAQSDIRCGHVGHSPGEKGKQRLLLSIRAFFEKVGHGGLGGTVAASYGHDFYLLARKVPQDFPHLCDIVESMMQDIGKTVGCCLQPGHAALVLLAARIADQANLVHAFLLSFCDLDGMRSELPLLGSAEDGRPRWRAGVVAPRRPEEAEGSRPRPRRSKCRSR